MCMVCEYLKRLSFEFSDDLEFIKNLFSMRCVYQFISKILPSPMFVMLTIAPQPGAGDIVDKTVQSHPNFRFILPVSKGKLGFCHKR